MPERDPSISPVCPACGSDAVVPNVVVFAAGYGIHTLHAGVITKPGALMNKGIVSSEAEYRACSDCGLVMQFATDPARLWEGHVERLANDADA